MEAALQGLMRHIGHLWLDKFVRDRPEQRKIRVRQSKPSLLLDDSKGLLVLLMILG